MKDFFIKCWLIVYVMLTATVVITMVTMQFVSRASPICFTKVMLYSPGGSTFN